MDFELIAHDLYGLEPSLFTAARDARAAEARRAGERDLAKSIGALRRPTRGAWLVNTLVRASPGRVEELADLGDAMRAAQDQLDGEQLRRLSRQRRDLLEELTGEAHTVARSAGVAVSDEMLGDLHRSLDAALAGADATDILRKGRLTVALAHSGFGSLGSSIDLASATSAGRAANHSPSTPGIPSTEPRAGEPAGGTDAHEDLLAEIEVAQASLSDAGVLTATARQHADDCELRAGAASRAVEHALDAISELESKLSGARAAVDQARREATDRDRERELALDALRAAERALTNAEDQLERLRHRRS